MHRRRSSTTLEAAFLVGQTGNLFVYGELPLMESESRAFGRTGLHIPRLVFGATSLGNLFRVVADEEKAAIVEAWLATPLNPVVIDTSGKYGAGLALEVIGRELERLQVPEERTLISNKLAWRRVPLRGLEPTFEPGAWFGLAHDAVQDIGYDGILRCWLEGNELLRGRSAQIVSVHDPDEYLAVSQTDADRRARLQDLIGAYRALCDLKDNGQVAAVGVGAKNWRVIQELSQFCDLDWVMVANSFTVMHHPKQLLEFMDELAERGIAIINSALFHGGFLVGGGYFDYRRLNPGSQEDQRRIDWRDKFHRVCQQFEVTPFHVGVAFGLAHPAVTAVALSSGRADRVATHMAAVEEPVPQEVWGELKRLRLLDESIDFVGD